VVSYQWSCIRSNARDKKAPLVAELCSYELCFQNSLRHTQETVSLQPQYALLNFNYCCTRRHKTQFNPWGNVSWVCMPCMLPCHTGKNSCPISREFVLQLYNHFQTQDLIHSVRFVIFFFFTQILRDLQSLTVKLGARGGAVCCGTALQAGRSRVRFPMVSLGFVHWYNPSGRTMALGLTQPPGMFPGGKDGRCVRLRTLSSSCADCLEIGEPQPPRTLWACLGL